MKLSEAIRLGAMLHPQGFGAYVTEETVSMNGLCVYSEVRTCAYGAALIAAGNTVADCLDPAGADAPSEWESVESRLCVCPSPDCVELLQGDNMIFHLNDDHHWTREQIADWVEQKECFMDAVWAPVTDEELVHV